MESSESKKIESYDPFPVVETALEVTNDFNSSSATNNNPQDQFNFLKKKKHKKAKKTLWYGLYDFFMCECSGPKR